MATVLALLCGTGCDPYPEPQEAPINWILARRVDGSLQVDVVLCDGPLRAAHLDVIIREWSEQSGNHSDHLVASAAGGEALTFPISVSTESDDTVLAVDPAGVQKILDGAVNVGVHISIEWTDGSRVESGFFAEALLQLRSDEYVSDIDTVTKAGLCDRSGEIAS